MNQIAEPIKTDNESILLGQILKDNEIYFKVTLKENYFHDPQNKRIYRAITDCISKGLTADIASVYSIDTNIRPGWLSEITNMAVSTANYQFYYTRMIEDAKKRALIKLPGIIAELNMSGKPQETIEAIEKYIADIATGNDARKIQTPAEILPGVVEQIEQRYHAKGQLPGISTGLKGLDDVLLGFRDRCLYYIGARPSDGKTALGLNIASHTAGELRIPTGFISLESGNEELIERNLSSVTSINSQHLSSGFVRKDDFSRIADAAGKIYETPIYFYDQPNAPLSDVESQARRMVASYGVKIIVIDYLQIIEYGTDRMLMRERVGHCSKSLKALARELNIPIVCLAQLSRDADGKRPQLKHFADASQIEKDADGAILIWHRENEKGELEESALFVDKNRNGRKAAVPVVFKREFLKFYDKSGRELL